MFKRKFLVVYNISFISILIMNLYAQSPSNELVINEVLLDTVNQKNSWIEIFNSSDSEIILKTLFTSYVKTPNLLPKEIKEQGGIIFKPKSYLIICWDLNEFKKNWQVPDEVKIIDNFRFYKKGGVIGIRGLNAMNKNLYDDIKFGLANKEIESESVGEMDINLYQFSLSRIPNAGDTNNCTEDFKISTPTPGRENIVK
ncbi:MAG: hypothetical protein JW956_04840 [Calditrichaceae bacterium]|nr:hypothetical protein [Calditrichaceae bacterium]